MVGKMSVLAAMTTMLLAAAAPASATTTEVAKANPQNIVYTCGVFKPVQVNATYHYTDDNVSHVVLKHKNAEMVLLVNKTEGKAVIFSNDEHEWTVAKPHPENKDTHPLDNGKLVKLKGNSTKGQSFITPHTMESDCYAEAM